MTTSLVGGFAQYEHGKSSHADALLRGFRDFERPMFTDARIADNSVTDMQLDPQTCADFRAASRPCMDPSEPRRIVGTVVVRSTQPMLTRYNGDGTWRVVQNGTLIAAGFDSEHEADEWINNQSRA